VETSVNTKSSTLVRGLGLSASIAVVMGSIIGQGIFLVPSQVARSVGSASWAIAAWLVGGTIVLFATFCYAELGAALPHTGGEYVYLERGLGSHWGFLFGWTSAVLQGPATAAWISAGLLRISAFLFPSVRVAILTWSIPEPFHADPYRFTFTYAQVWAALAIAAVAGINYFGVRKSWIRSDIAYRDQGRRHHLYHRAGLSV
jgi:basic amino acid/polyamine antiporter, APA family